MRLGAIRKMSSCYGGGLVDQDKEERPCLAFKCPR